MSVVVAVVAASLNLAKTSGPYGSDFRRILNSTMSQATWLIQKILSIRATPCKHIVIALLQFSLLSSSTARIRVGEN